MLTMVEFSHEGCRYRARLVERSPKDSWWYVSIDEVAPFPVMRACGEDRGEDTDVGGLTSRLVEAIKRQQNAAAAADDPVVTISRKPTS